MPKLFGLHEIELQPGVEPDDYERFFAEERIDLPTICLGTLLHLVVAEIHIRLEHASCISV